MNVYAARVRLAETLSVVHALRAHHASPHLRSGTALFAALACAHHEAELAAADYVQAHAAAYPRFHAPPESAEAPEPNRFVPDASPEGHRPSVQALLDEPEAENTPEDPLIEVEIVTESAGG